MENNNYYFLLEKLPDAFVYVKAHTNGKNEVKDCQILYVNLAFESMVGLKKEELVGKSLSEIMSEEQSSFSFLIEACNKVYTSGKTLQPENSIEIGEKHCYVTFYSDKTGFIAMILRDASHFQSEIFPDNKEYSDSAPPGLEGCMPGGLIRFQEEMLKTTAIWISILDKKGEVTFWNKAAENISGYTSEEVIGWGNIWELLYPDDEYRAQILKEWQNIYAEKQKVENFETMITRKDGFYRFVSWHYHDIIKNGEIIGGIMTGTDITTHKQVEEQLQALKEEYEKVFHGTQEALFMIEVIDSSTFRFIRNNHFHEKATGITLENIRGKTPQELVGKEHGEKIAAHYRQCVQTAVPITYEEELDLPGGKLTWETTLTPVFSKGKISYIVGSSHDITKNKQIEKEKEDTLHKLQKALEEAIYSMGIVVEKRDQYTAGHQQQVAKLAYAIAEEMGLDKERCKGLHLAAQLHDIGKIVIPSGILNKPGKLSELEFKIIKEHPQVGSEIVENIEFPWPLAEIICQHHEKINGSGYPQGLTQNEILLEARILCVADVVEAMSSHRPYRASLGVDTALQEISQQKGILFDAEVVDACLKIFQEKGFTLD